MSEINNKRDRNEGEVKDIILKIKEDEKEKYEKYDLLSFKLNQAENLFMEYEAMKNNSFTSHKDLWIKINEIINLVEINANYNFEFLKIQNLNKNAISKKDFDENFNRLSPTLSDKDYFELTNKRQQNPGDKLFELLNLYLNDRKKFESEVIKINNNYYNIPLIEGNERIRVNYYIQLLFSIYKDIQSEKCPTKLKELNNNFNPIKNGIEFFHKIIPKMGKFFKDINLEKNDFNSKLFLFLLFVTDIIDRIDRNINNHNYILNFFEKELDPLKELSEQKELKIKYESFEEDTSEKYWGIKKKENSEGMYTIYNKFESIDFEGKNYVIKNLAKDFFEHYEIPLDILLLRNQSLDFFIKNNKNFLNVNDKIYNNFIYYFKFFINSRCFRQALEKHEEYENILKLISNNQIVEKYLNRKYLISIPLFDFCGSGFTNKDILISCITGLPFIINGYNKIIKKDDYEELRNMIMIFNIAMKFIVTIREFIIHLLFGYLNYITEGKISFNSPKKINKKKGKDGGLLFENILFGKIYGNITFNDVLVILNGKNFDSLENFQDSLGENFNSNNFEIKSEFLKSIFEEYPLTLSNFDETEIYSCMKSSENGIYIKRDEMKIILPTKILKTVNIRKNK